MVRRTACYYRRPDLGLSLSRSETINIKMSIVPDDINFCWMCSTQLVFCLLRLHLFQIIKLVSQFIQPSTLMPAVLQRTEITTRYSADFNRTTSHGLRFRFRNTQAIWWRQYKSMTYYMTFTGYRLKIRSSGLLSSFLNRLHWMPGCLASCLQSYKPKRAIRSFTKNQLTVPHHELSFEQIIGCID